MGSTTTGVPKTGCFCLFWGGDIGQTLAAAIGKSVVADLAARDGQNVAQGAPISGGPGDLVRLRPASNAAPQGVFRFVPIERLSSCHPERVTTHRVLLHAMGSSEGSAFCRRL